MKQVQVTVSLHAFRRLFKNPQLISLQDNATIIDLFSILDSNYFSAIKEDGKSHLMDFFDKKVKSLLQLFWNPINQNFYGDTGMEARTPPPESNFIPLENSWHAPIPDDSRIILTPDPSC